MSENRSAEVHLRSHNQPGNSGRPVVLVTGGARRVGRAICRKLAHAGYDLFITYHTSVREMHSLEKELVSSGASVAHQSVDFNDISAVKKLAEDLTGNLPRLDAVVHNAAVYFATPLNELDSESVEMLYRINAASPLILTAGLADHLIQAQGSVVAVADIHACGLPRLNHSAYAMSKAALVEMVRSLARDLAPQVRVNAIAPGVVAWPEHGPDSSRVVQEQYLSRVPLQRAGTPDDAAELVLFLLEKAPYMTGQILNLDGGRSLI